MEGFKQDMPPPGGFKSVQFERVPLKKYMPGPVKWLITLGVMGYSWYMLALDRRQKRIDRLDKTSATISIYPLLLAESDRLKLKECRRIRDAERDLMKDVEGWKVGTYKGEPIYKSLGPDEWFEPSNFELWAHSDPSAVDFPGRIFTRY